MINLIAQDDFKYPFNVITGNEDKIEELDNIIEISQTKYLKKILGPIEYNKFENNITEQWWVDFVDGETYQKDTGTSILDVDYLGIKPVLAYLIYFDYQKYIQEERIKNGVAVLKMEEAIQVSPKALIYESYRLGLRSILTDSIYDPTVYNFLNEFHETDYPEWDFTQIKSINKLGI